MTRPPLRARFSLFRQRIILTIRWWSRLDIDAIKERNTSAQLGQLYELNDKHLETIRTMSGVLGQLQARLLWYEMHIPRMRDLKRQFEREQQKLQQSVSGPSEEAKRRLADGIIGAIQQ